MRSYDVTSWVNKSYVYCGVHFFVRTGCPNPCYFLPARCTNSHMAFSASLYTVLRLHMYEVVPPVSSNSAHRWEGMSDTEKSGKPSPRDSSVRRVLNVTFRGYFIFSCLSPWFASRHGEMLCCSYHSTVSTVHRATTWMGGTRWYYCTVYIRCCSLWDEGSSFWLAGSIFFVGGLSHAIDVVLALLVLSGLFDLSVCFWEGEAGRGRVYLFTVTICLDWVRNFVVWFGHFCVFSRWFVWWKRPSYVVRTK